jgi:hypothetical protein
VSDASATLSPGESVAEATLPSLPHRFLTRSEDRFFGFICSRSRLETRAFYLYLSPASVQPVL